MDNRHITETLTLHNVYNNKADFDCIFELRVNITIVYGHTVCATSAFIMCMLRVVFNVVLF